MDALSRVYFYVHCNDHQIDRHNDPNLSNMTRSLDVNSSKSGRCITPLYLFAVVFGLLENQIPPHYKLF